MATELFRIPTERKKTELINGQIRQRSVFENKPPDHKELVSDIIRSDCTNKGYRITGKTLGSGAYAKVKLAEVMVAKLARHTSMADHLENGKLQVAIKVIQKKIVPPEFLRKFLPRELDNHVYLPTHQNVVRCFEHFSSSDITYMVLEYLENGDLLDLINQSISRNARGLGEDITKNILRQICFGVRHIHQNGIVHRDLKCENILLNENMEIKITDFGFSCRYTDRNNTLKTSCGSYAYTAPEVIKNKPYDGVNADIWSLGIILCAMINGRLPYNDGHLTEMDEDMRMQRLRFERSVSFDCMVLVRKLLQYNPILRPDVEEILGDPWLTGKKPIPRQNGKPKWSSPYSANKGNEDPVKDRNKLRVDGSNPSKPSNPMCYRAVSPERSKPSSTGNDALILSKGARETIMLKSRRQGNLHRETAQTNERRPQTWPKSVKEQAEKIKTQVRTISIDKHNDDRIKQLMAITKDRARARNTKKTTKSAQDNPKSYTPLMYMFKYLQSNGDIQKRSSSPKTSSQYTSAPTVHHSVHKPTRPSAPNHSPRSSPTLFTKVQHKSTNIDSYGKPRKVEKNKKTVTLAHEQTEIPDLDFYEVDMIEVKDRCSPEARSKSVPATNNRHRFKKTPQTPAERAQSCRDRIMHAYKEKQAAKGTKEPPLPSLMVQKIDITETEGASPELGLSYQAPYRYQTKPTSRASSPVKYSVKTVYKYKYH